MDELEAEALAEPEPEALCVLAALLFACFFAEAEPAAELESPCALVATLPA